MLRIAHRGASGKNPENTLLSFKEALETDPDMIEIDIRCTKDKHVVVIHDATVDRTTNGKGKVKDYTLEDIQKLDAGKGEKIPTLEEVLKYVRGKAQVNIDVKERAAVLPTIQAIKTVVKQGLYTYDSFLISAFNPLILRDFQRQHFPVPLALNFSFFPDMFMLVSHLFNFEHIKPHRRVLKKRYITQAHKRGWKVIVWTINKPKDIEKMKKLGVDGIISDFPDRI